LNRAVAMSKFASPLLLFILFLGANAIQVEQGRSRGMETEIRAVPKPTARAVMADENMNIIGRQYYNTLCGFAEGNPSQCLSPAIQSSTPG